MLATKILLDDWKKWYLKEGHTVKSTMTYYNYIKLFVGEGIEINQKNVDKFRDLHYNTASSGSLKKFFYFLVVKHQAPRELLSLYFGKNKSTKKFPDSLAIVEIQKIVENMPTLKTKYLTIFLYELALRISEGLKVTFQDFNWSTWILNKEGYGTVNILHTKRDKFRQIPVKPEIMKMLYSDAVCKFKTAEGIPIGNIVFDFDIMEFLNHKEKTPEQNKYEYLEHAAAHYKNILYNVSKQVLNKRVHPHQLRHSKSQYLLDNGVSLEGLKLLLGHEKISTTEIYAQSSSTKLKKELEAIDKFMGQSTPPIK